MRLADHVKPISYLKSDATQIVVTAGHGGCATFTAQARAAP
ncbi:hypothetical protein LMG27177_06168 [Paraburkholderia fynbosensis]|uniref:Uncharacterized protein n=1 Tax=Paraburkholderia fynbosensis TaxID=1200993 RepID=A0A6J5GWW8_9BURK|nr:hypothetical protein LMG27177_06168 [Paraburkholderia fynbosensis]